MRYLARNIKLPSMAIQARLHAKKKFMSLMHWVGYRTWKLDNGNVVLYGRAWYVFPVILIVTIAGFGIPASLIGNEYYAFGQFDTLLLLLMGFITILGWIHFLWFFSFARTVLFSSDGFISITDRSILRRRSVSYPTSELIGVRFSVFSSREALFKFVYIDISLSSKRRVRLITNDAPLYLWQARKAHPLIVDYLSTQGLSISVTTPKELM